ncbi:maltose permease [Flagelloscypha sp. PMI_526]|nr:maltose permease [Flagelloscypha sp. PMI_526]
MSHPQDVVVHHEDIAIDATVVSEAAKGDAAEHQMTLGEAWRSHRAAVLWSMGLSAALIMEGYDVIVISSFYGHPAFLKRFGYVREGTATGYAISAEWQSALNNGSSAGGIIGLIINGWAADRYGPKKVMLFSLVLLAGLIFIFVFANSLEMLVIAEVFCGIPWGIFQTLTTAYASEVCPIQLRGYLTSYVNLCWGVGILLSSGVVTATSKHTGDWSWRLPFVLQWMWIPPLLAIVWFAPMSPWWLVRNNRLEEAQQSVRRLASSSYVSDEECKNTVALMVHTNELERQLEEGTTYLECFKGIDGRRTEIVMMTFAMQLLSGQNLAGQAIQFLQSAGLTTSQSFSLGMVLNAMFIIGTIVSWFLLPWFGRRTLYTAGMFFMCVVLYAIGGLGYSPGGADKAIGGLLILLNFVYNSTLGPLCYTIIGEIPSTRLRQKSIALSRIAYQTVNIICGIINPRMLAIDSWNWGAKSGIFWGTSAALCTIYCLFRMPEGKNRSYGELDILFENKVPAWRFKSTKVEQFGSHESKTADHDSDVKEDVKA